ncbi:MAG: hypothetical protein HY537_08160 [Deltaproteobacteria bacterium]|nr:hypothetical protein [Deltaproteobacteria bacterium]
MNDETALADKKIKSLTVRSMEMLNPVETGSTGKPNEIHQEPATITGAEHLLG